MPSLAARFLSLLLLGGMIAGSGMGQRASAAEAISVGTASGLPVPRYVSLKSDRVNLREGPSKDHRTSWVSQRAGLPVEITAEAETWRRIRDSDGAEGWVLHSLLSGRRTALVAPWWKQGPLPLFAKLYPPPKVRPVSLGAGIHSWGWTDDQLPQGIVPPVAKLWHDAIMNGFFRRME